MGITYKIPRLTSGRKTASTVAIKITSADDARTTGRFPARRNQEIQSVRTTSPRVIIRSASGRTLTESWPKDSLDETERIMFTNTNCFPSLQAEPPRFCLALR